MCTHTDMYIHTYVYKSICDSLSVENHEFWYLPYYGFILMSLLDIFVTFFSDSGNLIFIILSTLIYLPNAWIVICYLFVNICLVFISSLRVYRLHTMLQNYLQITNYYPPPFNIVVFFIWNIFSFVSISIWNIFFLFVFRVFPYPNWFYCHFFLVCMVLIWFNVQKYSQKSVTPSLSSTSSCPPLVNSLTSFSMSFLCFFLQK